MKKLFFPVFCIFLSRVAISMDQYAVEAAAGTRAPASDFVSGMQTRTSTKSDRKTCRVGDAFDLGFYAEREGFLFRFLFSVNNQSERVGFFTWLWNRMNMHNSEE